MNKNKLITLIILTVVVVVIVGVIGFGYRAKAPEVTTGGISANATGPLTITASSTSGSGSISMVLSTSTQKSYGNESFSFDYPPSWSIVTYSPFSMTNFGGNYLKGGIIPIGGAQIYITTTTVESGFLPSIISTQLMNAMNMTTTTLMVDGVACPAAAYEAAYAPGVVSKNVSVYCPRGTEVWEVYLSYEASDTDMAARVADFNSVLASMKFLP
jgi:hypothetical protein